MYETGVKQALYLTLYSPTPQKWLNTLKQFVDFCQRIV